MGDIDFKGAYIAWIKENIEQYKINDSTYRITLPFLDRNNDHIEVYIQKNSYNEKFTITDDSSTLSELFLSGFEFRTSEKRRLLLNQILNAHGVSRNENDALVIEATFSEIPLKKHMLAQAIQKISDLFYLSRASVRSVFLEDVQSYLDENSIRYTPSPSFIGKSKLPTNYDFVIPKSKKAPERIVKVARNLNNEYAKSIIFSWSDIIDLREKGSRLYTFYQDYEDINASSDALTALNEYDIKPIAWSNRNQYVLELAE